MTTLDRLGPDDLRSVMVTFAEALAAHRHTINKLNVYPVPDGDTGSNMAGTARAVVEALPEAGADMAGVCAAIGHASLMGAQGNSGVILSQLLRGMTEVLREVDKIDGRLFAHSLVRASELAYQAVGNPKEGTILTVVREAAEAGRGCRRLARRGPRRRPRRGRPPASTARRSCWRCSHRPAWSTRAGRGSCCCSTRRCR